MNIKLLSPSDWKDYELIDCGNFEKLERFGRYTIARPEPQAIWNKSLPASEWEQRADAYFRKDKRNEERGEWICKPRMAQQWFVNYVHDSMKIRLRLGLTSFKHVGIFPEQAENWNFIHEQTRRIGNNCRVLNLFAYTGGASLAAKSAGARGRRPKIRPQGSETRQTLQRNHSRSPRLRTRPGRRKMDSRGKHQRDAYLVQPTPGRQKQLSRSKPLFHGIIRTTGKKCGTSTLWSMSRGTIRGTIRHGFLRESPSPGRILPHVERIRLNAPPYVPIAHSSGPESY